MSGTGEAGATVSVRAPTGAVIGTAIVAADGSYTASLSPAQTDGERLTIRQADAAGNVSTDTSATAPDLVVNTRPDAPTATVAADGALVTGVAAAGAAVTLYDADGTVIARGVAAADGRYAVALTPALVDGETIRVTQTDADGDVSPPATAVAPDLTAPALPTADVAADGRAITGTGEAGATVTVRGTGGTILGIATVAADGSYAVALVPAQANGETLSVSQADAAGNASAALSLAAPDVTAPAAPTAIVAGDGVTVSGLGEPGATVVVTNPAGATIGTATVAADGRYTATLSTAQTNGERLGATQVDTAGNVSAGVAARAPDLTAPALPTATIASGGTAIAGTGEPGARLTVTGSGGTVLGTATVAADGSYTVALVPAQANGETLSVVQTDAAGNASAALSLVAPDITAPAAPVATLDATGAIVIGTGEPGARIAVTDAAGTLLGQALVTAGGSYTVALVPAQIDSQRLAVVQTDAAGNVSPAIALVAPDLTAPTAPTATVDAAGTALTGTGEAGATVTIRDPLGVVVGTATVGADGTFIAPLAPSQTDGQLLSVRQADAAGNVSPAATATAPDLVMDSDPAAPTAAVGADGTAVTGLALAGAAITVYDAGGTVIATGVAASDGRYSVALSPARIDGETVRVTQTEADGDVSPPATAIAPDLTAPLAPTAVLDGTGGVVTGTGEPGATIAVRAADGTLLGTATVTAGGAYAATLTPAQTNGETIAVAQADARGNVSPSIALVAPDVTAPAAPVATVTADGTAVTGSGEPGATATVRSAAGTILGTASIAGDGSFVVSLSPVQANGGTVTVTVADQAGNVSPPVVAAAPDITAPDAPLVQVAADGSALSGTGEAGATIVVRDGAGASIGTAIVAADGRFTAVLTPVQANGGTVSVVQTDAAGNASLPATITAPDLLVPAAPTLAVAADGASVTGTGEPGARIVVTDAAGVALGVAVVAADGSYAASLSTAQLNGERLIATQTDGGGNVSPPVAATAPDLTAPAAPTLAIAGDGALASGIGEPGATVTLRNPDGSIVATAPVGADGSFAIALVPARVDGELLSVTQADAAGNVSPVATDAAPDLTAPAAPTATIAADGTSISGIGEVGATVLVSAAGGAPLGSAVVGSDGRYTVSLTAVQGNGQSLVVSQVDAAGNASPAAPVIAPDFTAPAAPTALVALDGASVAGTGEPGATVTIARADGTPLGTAVVGADGSYVASLSTPQTNGELLGARQSDPSGNVSASVAALAPDTTPPAAPTATVSGNGTIVAGLGEPGATVTVIGTAGTLGTALVGADGRYAVSLGTAQIDGQTLTVTQADRAGNVSPPVTAIAPDTVSPLVPTATVGLDGATVVGTGMAGARITVTGTGGALLGTATVAADGSYTVALTVAQRNGELLGVVQGDAAGNLSPTVFTAAPDLTAPNAPSVVIGGQGDVVTGLGEPGTTVSIATSAGAVLGSGTVAADGSYLVTLAPAQRNGEPVVVTLSDAAGNVSAAVTVVAPDLTAPPPPTVLAIAPDGTSVTGTGEAGARVTVRDPASAVLGTAVVAADGSFTVGLLPAQVAGATLAVTQADVAGNVSGATAIVAPFDIDAFDNVAAASIDLVPATTPVTYGTAGYLALVSLGLVNLQAEVLTVENVRFTVQPGHSLDAVFTYDALATIGAASGYAVVVQRLEGTQWVAVDGTGAASLLEIGLLDGNLSATDTLGPGEYRAFLTFQGAAGAGLLGGLTVAGVVSDFTDVAAVTPGAATGNVITDAGPGGEVDVVSLGTRVASVTIGGVTTAVAAGGSVVAGVWGTLAINPDGSYSYTPTASATAIGHTDVFTYTLLDPTDGERESANLTITIGSPDITGAPVAVADQAIAAVTFAPVVTVVAPATAFTFASQPAGVLQPSTGAGTGSFTVAANAVADVTVSAIRQPGLSASLLPSYTLTVYEGATVVRTETRPSLAGLPIGTGATFTLDDLPSGNYTYTVRSSAALGTFGTTVSLGSTTESLVNFTLSGRETATGNLLDNDVAHTPFAAIRVDAGAGFAEVGDAPVTLVGLHGTLTVDETGGYVYQPSASLGYSAVDLTDHFTYQLAQPDGTVANATLTVTIDVPADGVAAQTGAMVALQMGHGEADVIPLDALTAHVAVAAAAPDAAAIGLATYGLFEGRGEVEDVLSHYLGDQQNGVASDVAGSSPAVLVENGPAHPMVDSLDYLVGLADQPQENQGIHHVI